MSKHKTFQTEQTDQRHGESQLKGTLASVMLLGAFLVLSWVSVFVLFISRG